MLTYIQVSFISSSILFSGLCYLCMYVCVNLINHPDNQDNHVYSNSNV